MRVLLIDEDFSDDCGGHSAAYDIPVAKELAARGVDAFIFVDAHARLSAFSDVHIVPAFTKSKWIRRIGPRVPRFMLQALRIVVGNVCTLRDLVRCVSPKVETGDCLLICRPTSQGRMAYALWSLLLSVRRVRLLQVYVFHNMPHVLFRHEASLLHYLTRDHRVFYIAHTAPLAQLCRKVTKKNCYVFPLPFDPPAQFGRPVRDSSRPISFTYLGLAHQDKGLGTIVDAINGHLQDLLLSSVIEFVIQFYSIAGAECSDALKDKLLASAIENKGVHLIEAPLSPDRYLAEMADADVILIPHKARAFGQALSGVFVEALSVGKPVIVAEATYMADQLRCYGAGETFTDEDCVSFAQAIRKAVKQIDQLVEQAFRRRAEWLEHHNGREFVDQLFVRLTLEESV